MLLIFCWNCDQFLDSLLYSRAYWVTEGVIAWNVDVGEGSCYLYASRVAGLSFSEDGIDGALTFYLSSFVTTVFLNQIHSFSGFDFRVKLEAESGSLRTNVSCTFSALYFNKKKNSKWKY